MRSIADLHPIEAKTNALYVAIITKTAFTTPHAPNGAWASDQYIVELFVSYRFGESFAKRAVAPSGRMHDPMTEIRRGPEGTIHASLTTQRRSNCRLSSWNPKQHSRREIPRWNHLYACDRTDQGIIGKWPYSHPCTSSLRRPRASRPQASTYSSRTPLLIPQESIGQRIRPGQAF